MVGIVREAVGRVTVRPAAEIFERLKLPIGSVIDGPAILEQPDTTIFIEPGVTGSVDRFGNIILAPQEAA